MILLMVLQYVSMKAKQVTVSLDNMNECDMRVCSRCRMKADVCVNDSV